MLKSVTIKDTGPVVGAAHVDLAPRLNVITGDNGLGKSFFLDVVFWLLTREWPHEQAWADAEIQAVPRLEAWVGPYSLQGPYDHTRQIWVGPSIGGSGRDGPTLPLVLYAGPHDGYALHDSRRSTKQRPISRLPFIRDVSETLLLSTSAVWDGLKSGKKYRCNGLIRDWVDWQFRVHHRFAALEAVVKELADAGDAPLKLGQPKRVRLDDSREIPCLSLPYGDVPITLLSAAHRRILSVAYLMVWLWHEHEAAAKLSKLAPVDQMLVLVDEPEAHLHPRWQRAILPSILKAARVLAPKVKIQMLVTTHSPLVLASVEDLYDEKKDRVLRMELDTRKRVVFTPHLFAPLGRADTWLMSDVFGLRQPTSKGAEKAIEEAGKIIGTPKPAIGRIRKARAKLAKHLPDTAPLRALMAAKEEHLSARSRNGRRRGK